MTKLELIRENKDLRSQVKEFKKLIKEMGEELKIQEMNLDNLKEKAIGVIRDKSGYSLVDLKYNPETGEATVINIDPPMTRPYAVTKGRRRFIEEIFRNKILIRR